MFALGNKYGPSGQLDFFYIYIMTVYVYGVCVGLCK